MKKLMIAALLLTAMASDAQASTAGGGGRKWDLCATEFPGLGHLGAIFLLPCSILETAANA